MIGAGMSPKLVAQRLGHANVSITVSVSSHILPGHDQAAADDQSVTTALRARV